MQLDILILHFDFNLLNITNRVFFFMIKLSGLFHLHEIHQAFCIELKSRASWCNALYYIASMLYRRYLVIISDSYICVF